MTSLSTELRRAARSWRRTPGLALTALLTLAIGIGANVAVFSLVDEIWLRPLPVPQPEQLVRIFTSQSSSEGEIDRGPNSYPDFESLRTSTQTLSGVAALERRGALLDTGHESKLVTAAVVSGNFFDLLAPTAAQGRTFTAAEAAAPGSRVVMLSHSFWRSQFDADPSLPGRTIVVDRQEVLVAGVLPRGFRGTGAMVVSDLWIPQETWMALTDDRVRPTRRDFRDYAIFGRRRPGATLTTVNAELDLVGARLAQEEPKSNAGRRMTAIPESESRRAGVARLSSTLLVIAAFVLLLACANVASLLLARGDSLRPELATRAALGASRSRLVRQLASETALLAAAAVVAALLVGGAMIAYLPGLLPDLGFSAPIDPHLNGRVLLFALGASLGALALFGLLPAWLVSGAAPIAVLRGRHGLTGAPRARLRSALVVAQVALSTMLVVASGLLVRSLVAARDADPGFDAHQNLLVLELVPGFGASEPGAQRQFAEEARRRIEAIPGVVGTALTMRVPFGLSGSGATRKAFLPGVAPTTQIDGTPIRYNPVGDRFFSLLGTRLLRGRAIDERDVRSGARVVVVNETMANRYWPDREAIGQRLRLDRRDDEPFEVIGVAEDSANDELGAAPAPYFYTPMTDGDFGELALVVKTAGDAGAAADAVRRALRELNPAVPTLYLATMRQHMRLATSDLRMTAGLVVALGALGLLLSAVGLHGLVTFLAGRRTRELGLRMALGARPLSIFDLVIRGALRLSLLGLLLGAVGAAAVTRALRSLLYGVEAGDPASFAAAFAVIVAATLAASFLPARRAARTDPSEALRVE